MKLLKYLGQAYTDNGEDAKTQCLWCSGDSLEISLEAPHQFQCWKCHKTGNAYTLIQGYYESLPECTLKDFKYLASLKKGTFVSSFRAYQIKKSARGYVWPIRNAEGDIIALYRYNESDNNWYSSPKPVSMTLIGQDKLKATGTVWIVEGHWDTAAFLPYVPETDSLLGVCGSNYPVKRLKLLHERDIVVLFDNDTAGDEGRRRLCINLKQSGGLPTSARYLKWDTVSIPNFEIPSGFDTRDLCNAIKEYSL